MAKAATKRKSKYSAHPGLLQEAADKEKLRAKTGRTFDEWVEFARKKGPKTQRECRAWLQKEHGHGMREAWWLAATATAADDQPNYSDPETLVDALYAGPKAALRPIHEKVVDAALACGDDVIATSCKTMVPLYRKHVFAELRPVRDAVEVGLSLGDVAAKGRLQPSDGRQPGDRLTHLVLLKSEKDVDAEFSGWLAKAYEAGAGKLKRAASAKTPADLASALKASAKAKATWDACTPAMQRDWIQWIESAKQDATRAKRVGQAVDKLAGGKRKMY
jgi:hypothetical protein